MQEDMASKFNSMQNEMHLWKVKFPLSRTGLIFLNKKMRKCLKSKRKKFKFFETKNANY